MTYPLVSIITPLYNCESHIHDTVLSVIKQTYPHWELLLVDDCSTDSSLTIALQYANDDPRIRVIRMTTNSGAAVARNAAIKEAEGQFIAFLDSDDLWLPHKLEKQLDFMHQKNCALSFSAYQKIDERGKDLGVVGVPETVSHQELLKTCVIGCLTAMYDSQKIGKVYMPLIRKRQDFGLWLSILKKIDIAYGISEPLAQYRVRRDSISANKLKAAQYTWHLFRHVEQLSLIKSVYYFIHYACRGVLRTKFPRLARSLNVLH
ncbi:MULTISPECIES: glycosyltransferase family 2 protein [unclassified Salinivibrio]|uniref:glycosyltransferase family 2 protein n=1 Tax=unclassified Salinivibrio TaxID=2636825 RepID=UPI00092A8503|nr:MULTISPECIES: glycosyltransferase family 2 protein [unclassified Salinivibrio]OOE73675.1 glycosyl transferase [Salinivibrio sp. ML290]SIN79292.1 Glycosyl transferase family 2 [Salinivibrio sp. ES.052]